MYPRCRAFDANLAMRAHSRGLLPWDVVRMQCAGYIRQTFSRYCGDIGGTRRLDHIIQLVLAMRRKGVTKRQ